MAKDREKILSAVRKKEQERINSGRAAVEIYEKSGTYDRPSQTGSDVRTKPEGNITSQLTQRNANKFGYADTFKGTETIKASDVVPKPLLNTPSTNKLYDQAYKYTLESKAKETEMRKNYANLDKATMFDISLISQGREASKMTTGLSGLVTGYSSMLNKSTAYSDARMAVDSGNKAYQRLIDQGYSEQEVEQWVKMYSSQESEEFNKRIEEDAVKLAEKSPVLASAGTVILNVASAPVTAAAIIDDSARGEIDTNNKMLMPKKASDTIRSTVSEDIAEDSKVGAWLYDVGMSGADSLVAGFMPGGMGALTLATNAAVDTTLDLTERGVGAEQALIGGIAAGAFEAIFEKWSIGEFKAMKEVSPLGVKDIIKNLAKSMGVNASEESLTELANILYDTVTNGDASNYQIMVKNLMANGMTEEQAKKEASKQMALQVLEAGVAGAVMGVGFSSVGSATGFVRNSSSAKALGSAIRQSGEADAIIAEGNAAPDWSRPYAAAQKAQNKLDKGKSADRALGVAAIENDKYIADNTHSPVGAFASAKTIDEVGEIYNEKKAVIESATMTKSERNKALKQLEREHNKSVDALYYTEAFKAPQMRAAGKAQSSPEAIVKAKMPTIGTDDDGNAVSVSKIEGIKDGSITVKTSEGVTQELNIKNIKSIDAQTLWTNAVQNFSDAESAQAFIDNYDGGTIADYTKAFKDYYYLAATGMSLDQINEHEIAPYNDLSEQAQVAAVELGQKAISYQQGVVDLTAKRKNKAQQLQVNMLDSIGKQIGMNVVVVDTLSKFDGFHRTGTNQIVVALDSSSGAILRTAGHETYHFVKEEMSDRAKDIETFVLDTLKKNKGEKWVNDRLKFYEKQGYKTKEAQTDELVADSLFDAFTNERAVKDFATKNQSLAKKLVNHIHKLVADIKNIINKLVASGKYDEIKAWQDDVASLEKLNNMFLNALDELAAKSTDDTTKNADNIITIGEFKFSTKVSFEEQVNDALSGKLNRRNALYVSETPVLLQEIGMKQLPMLYTQKHLSDAMKPKSSKNSHYHGLTKEQILMMPDIVINPAIIMDSMSQENSIVIVSDVLDNDKAPIIMSIVANGTGVYELENIESNFISSYYGKDNGFEGFIDRALKTNNILYVSKEKSQSLYRQTGLQLPGGFNKLGFDKIIHQSNNIVNINSMQKSEKNTTSKSTKRDSDYMTAVENGDTEAAQKMVDEAAENSMPDSIIRGDDDKLLTVYHGSPSKFTVFRHNKLNVNGNAHGRGFYFTEEKSMAEGYSKEVGQLLSGYLNITKPMSEDKITIKKPDLIKLIKATCEAEAEQLVADGGYDNVSDAINDTWVSNYVYTYGTDMRQVYKEVADILYNNDSDVQIIAEMTNVAGAENILKNVYQFTGYDGVVYTNDRGTHEYVALTSNQFKSADLVTYDNDGNVIPLSERFNEKQEDIRYARKRYWYPDMSNADLEYIKRLAKNELSKTDNYLDNITKWLYNRKNGTSYFALYSTEDENEPTILYASISNQAIAEHNFVMLYLNELEDESDDGKAKAFNEILEDLENTDDLRTVHSGMSSDRRNGNGDVSVHSRPSRSRLSRALLVCLQDSYERRGSGEGINKYSTKRETSISEEASNYILDTKEYQDVIGVLERRFNTLGKVMLSPKAIDRYAGRLLQKSKSNYSREQLTGRLIALFDFIANSREVTWEEVTGIAANIAKDMLTESQTLDRSMQQEYADVLKLMKESRVYISPDVRAEINHNFGSLEAFRKRIGSKLKITVTDESAVPLDVFWRELSEYRPEMFEADTNYLDMPSELVNFFEITSPQYINPYNIEMDMDEAAYDFALQMYDEYFEIPEVKTEAQKYAAKLQMLKGHYNAKIKEIHNSYRERIKEIRTDLKAENKQQIAVTKELYRSRNEKYRNKQKETRDKQRLRAQIYRLAQNLTNKLVNPTDQKHIPQELISAVNDFCGTITESGVFTPDRANKLRKAFKNIGENSVDPDTNLSTMYNEEIAEMLEQLHDVIAGRRLGELNINELARVKIAANYFTHIVSMSNRAFSDNIKEKLLDLQSNAIVELNKIPPGRKRFNKEMQIGLLKPVTFFELLESPTLMKLYENIRQGEGKWYNTVASAKRRRKEAAKKHDYKSWKNDKITFKPERLDGEIVLSVDEALSIYATANREQGVDHIRLGGIVREEDAKKKLNSKEKAKSVDIRNENIPLTVNDMIEITSQLTKEQKAYADDLIDFMSKDMAALGNEVSMKLFGIKKFNEKKYFPLKSAINFLYSKPAVENDARIKHMSMTKQTIPKADNPVIIGNFTETVMNHCNDMALYYSFCLPLEDFNRVYNFKTQPTMFERSTSIKQKIDMAYGSKANRYIKQFLTDINGGVTQQAGSGFVNKMVAKAKKNAVFGSLSVAVQQPSAVARTFLYIDPKYFVASSFSKKDWNELKKYAPVAGVKEMGYFDTNVGKQAVDWMAEDGHDKLSEKAFALFKEKDYRDDLLSFLPSYMDKITWGHIWNAVKKETAHNYPDMDRKSEEFLKLAGERFTYVIDRTQVYDSVFARSEWMRSKDTGVKVATAFMSEPLTNYNMLYLAAVKARHGDAKFALKAVSAYIVSVAFNSVLKSLVTAGRDDDEDKSYWEKYLSDVVANFIEEPFGMIPYLKDFVSLMQGYDSNRMDTQVLADLAKSVKTISDSNKTPYEKVKSVFGTVGIVTGVPLKNLWRDSEMVVTAVKKIFNGDFEPTTKQGIINAVKEDTGMETLNAYEQLVDAYLEGDKTHYDKVDNNLKAKKSEDAISNGIKAAVKNKYRAGTITEEQVTDVLQKLIGYDENKVYWIIDEWNSDDGEYSKYNDFSESIRTGNDLKEVINDYLEHGVEKKTLASQITKTFKQEYIDLYRTDRAEASALRRRLLDAYVALGYDRDDKADDIAEWLE